MRDISNLLKPGIHYISCQHDHDCLTLETQKMTDCTCQPEIMQVSERTMLKQMEMGRTARRKAQREAEKAMRKAKGGKS